MNGQIQYNTILIDALTSIDLRSVLSYPGATPTPRHDHHHHRIQPCRSILCTLRYILGFLSDI